MGVARRGARRSATNAPEVCLSTHHSQEQCHTHPRIPHLRSRATHGEDHGPAMPIAHTAYARDGARGRVVRGELRISGRCRRVVVGEARRGVFRIYLKFSNHPKTRRAFPQRDQK